ncbi:MAG: rhomboid family intramembrane serine protease [Verrucomicrobiae bacterium]|nr:rhomboid family intramembrane serine protease [Verrucomicrobiae bacterium]
MQGTGEFLAENEELQPWKPGEVWFRQLIPRERPWGREELLEPVPEDAGGLYGLKIGSSVKADGQSYREGEIVVADSRGELMQLMERLGTAVGVIFPWYDRIIPVSLLSPHREKVDLPEFRLQHRDRILRSFFITAALVGVSFYLPGTKMLTLLFAAFYGLFPLVESVMGWLQRVDRLTVEELNRRLVNFEFFRRWLATRRSKWLLPGVVVLVLVFVCQMAAGLDQSIEAAALVKERVREQGEWWRLVTTGLMHANIVHILFNGMALYSLGRVIVALVSPSLLGFVFLVTVVTGSLASLYLGPAKPSVGASGGILGCLGFLLVVTWRFRGVLPGFLRMSLLQSTVVMAIFGFLGADFIDNAAHGGGFLGGVLLGGLFYPRMRLAPESTRPVVRAASILSLAILAAGVGKVCWELWKTVSV